MKIILFILVGFSLLQASFNRDTTEDIVTDTETGLIWQDDINASTLTKNWQGAIDYCEALDFAGQIDWRLPNKRELLSIVDYSVYSPSMSSIFQNITSSYYWSSTTYANGTSNAWDVNFSYGSAHYSNKSDSTPVRCVRGGQYDTLESIMTVPSPKITLSGDPDAVYTFSVDLNDTLAEGHYVAINFDNLQGDWFTQADEGGHIKLVPDVSGTRHSLNRSINKPGLRSFRAGIFNANDELVGEYSDSTTCIEDSCLADTPISSNFGNPQLNGNGSQLFGGVDVANGNLHFSSVDMSIQGKGPDFTLIRAYNSNSGLWSFNLDTALSFVTDTFNRQITVGPREDGRIDTYYKDMDKKWYALNPGNFDQLVEDGNESFTLYTQGNLYYKFDQPTDSVDGKLLSINDRDGNALTFSHTSNLVTGATDDSGRTYTIARDTNGRITKVTDFTQRYVGYTYNSDGMVTAYKNPKGLTSNYTYSGTKLLSLKDPRGNVVRQYTYYTTGSYRNFVKTITWADATQWEYLPAIDGIAIKRPDTNGKKNTVGFVLDAKRMKVIERIDAQNYGDYKTKMQYRTTTNRQRIAEFGLVEQTTNPRLKATTTTYYDDGTGNIAAIIEPTVGQITKITSLTYEDENLAQPNLTPVNAVYAPGIATPTKYQDFTTSGKAKTVINTLGDSTYNTYDAEGKLTQVKDARTNATNVTYDTQGRIKRVTNALGYYTENTYDTLGRVTKVRDQRGNFTSFTYDLNGNLLTSTDADNGVTRYTYDNSDNLVSVKDPKNVTTTYTYDTSNRKVRDNYTAGGVTYTRIYTYDALGRVHKVTNESSNVSEMQFDERGQVLNSINPLSQTTTYTYDANGNVLTVKDAENRKITNVYDDLDRKTKVTDSLGLYESYTYNTKGFLASKRDKKGLMTYYTYDDLGQMTKIVDPENGTTKATYDANGNIATVTDRKNQTVTYTYDKLNRLTKQKDSLNREWTFTYDANGNMLTKTLPSTKVISYTYDKLNRVTKVVYHDGQTVTYSYDKNSNRISMVDSQGTTTYSYDELNRLTNVKNAYGVSIGYTYHPTGTLNELIYPTNKKVTYTYDNADRLKNLTDWLGDTTSYTRDNTGFTTKVTYGNGATVNQTYDVAGRLNYLSNKQSNGSVISSHTLTLDKLGNPTSIAADLPLIPVNLGKHTEMLYDSTNRITKINNLSITHDTDGRLTADNTHDDILTYTYNAQDLITSMRIDGLVSDTFTYDGDGHRTSKTVGGTTTRYLQDITGGDVYALLAETDAVNNIQYAYVYGEGLVSQIDGTSHKYYHYDQSGNTLALSNDSGVMTDSYAYEPFGMTTVDGNSYNPFKFVGRYGVMDDGNGLHYMRARYYRADMKRFQSIDALSGQVTEPMTLNRYQYVSGNPMVGVDSSGYASNNIFVNTWSGITSGFVRGNTWILDNTRYINPGYFLHGEEQFDQSVKLGYDTADMVDDYFDADKNSYFYIGAEFLSPSLDFVAKKGKTLYNGAEELYANPGVYIVGVRSTYENVANSVKIYVGKANEISERLSNSKRGNHEIIEVLQVIYTKNSKEALDLERKIIKYLDQKAFLKDIPSLGNKQLAPYSLIKNRVKDALNKLASELP